MSDEPRPRRVTAVVGDGWRRVAGAPALWIGMWVVTLLVTLPPAWRMQSVIASDLGHSLSGTKAWRGVDWHWWQEFEYRHPDAGETFRPSVIGFAAVLRDASGLVDATGLPPSAVGIAITYGAAWVFLLGGLLDRYARDRRIGAGAFFGACGVYFWRFLRLAAVALVLYLVVFWIHARLFTDLYPIITRDLAVERTAFLVYVLLYVPVAGLLAFVMVWLDLAKARAVIEDRRSMIGALAAAGRFFRREPGACIGAFTLNVLLFLLVVAIYAVVAPGAGSGRRLSLLYAVIAGQLFILGRIWVKLAFYATAVALVQDRLAHAQYVATPPFVWPDSPAAEAIREAE
jgi:hypothetical protein